MTRLLVSVRSAEEAEIALAGGADVIDVKEPRRGALGPSDPAVWREIQLVVEAQAITSAALGELLHDPVGQLAGQTNGFAFAKIGLADCRLHDDWKLTWDRTVNALPRSVYPVPVAYADHARARSPRIEEVLELAQTSSARLLLIDTFDKRAGRLLDHLPLDFLTTLLDQAAARDVQVALAGSLQLNDIDKLLPLAPAYIGVRGAACRGGRDGVVDLARVKSLAIRIRNSVQNDSSCCLTPTIATPILPCR